MPEALMDLATKPGCPELTNKPDLDRILVAALLVLMLLVNRGELRAIVLVNRKYKANC